MIRSCIALSLVTLAGLGTPSAAQPPAASANTDTRWSAFIGCWRAADDRFDTGTRVCVAPATGGVTLTTIVGGQKVSEDTRVADGAAHPVDRDGCLGTETVRWSNSGFRLYRTATIACDGGEPRTLATASFFAPGPAWVDVETVEADSTTSVRVSRLARSGNQQLPDGTAIVPPVGGRGLSAEALAGFTAADVIDLSRALPADGVQAALTEAPTRFRLNAKTLVAMADAGVGDRVIDLMVALTYPKRFEVQRVASGGWSGGPGVSSMADPFFAPLVGPAAMFNCYSSYGWAASSYWGNCMGYNPYTYARYPGYYNGYWGAYGPGWIVTQPGTGGTGAPVTPSGEGRVVNGRGYTQVRPVDTTFTMAGGGRSSGADGSQSPSSGTSSGSGVSGSGYSGGSSGGGERTAVPRGPGGDR